MARGKLFYHTEHFKGLRNHSGMPLYKTYVQQSGFQMSFLK